MNHRPWLPAFITAALAAPAFAQTGAPLLLTPWDRVGDAEAGYEGSASVLAIGDTDLDVGDEELSFSEFESRGRIKLTDRPGPGPAIGFDLLYYDLDHDSDALPDRLADVSVAAAFGVPLGDSSWEAGVVAGVGYAGTRPFADSDGIYFMGDLIFKRQIDDVSSFTFALNYDGNRSILPDVPLPAAYYARKLSEQLHVTVGLPYSSIRWTPTDRWSVTATASAFALPFVADVTVAYALADDLSLYGSFESRRPAFWLEDADNERIFFQQRRLEAGLRYGVRNGGTLIVAGGWAFDQEFETGWDVRDTDDVRELDDAPYLRVALDLAF